MESTDCDAQLYALSLINALIEKCPTESQKRTIMDIMKELRIENILQVSKLVELRSVLFLALGANCCDFRPSDSVRLLETFIILFLQLCI